MGWMSSVQVHSEAVCLSGLGLEAESYERSGSSATSVPPVLRCCPTTIGLGLDCPMPCFLAFATLRESSTWINSPSLDFHRSLRPDPFFFSFFLFFFAACLAVPVILSFKSARLWSLTFSQNCCPCHRTSYPTTVPRAY